MTFPVDSMEMNHTNVQEFIADYLKLEVREMREKYANTWKKVLERKVINNLIDFKEL